jgi:Ca2+-binding EF-hand superfamily protein
MASNDDLLMDLKGDTIIGDRTRQIFKMFDQDGDSLINMEELRQIFKQMGQNPTEDELIDMLVEVDAD